MTATHSSPDSADQRLAALARQVEQTTGLPFAGELAIGGHYSPTVRDGEHLYVSGQIPRMGTQVLYIGAVGADLDLNAARDAATLCTLRALTWVQRAAGSLAQVRTLPRMTVYVRSAPDFTSQSEVADAASDAIAAVLGPVGAHTRTSVGVMQLSKGAAVELDLVVRVG